MNIFELLKVFFLGIVEGITEWLPISSTGHMILVDEFVHLNVTKEFMDVFIVVIQLGAILAVVVMYFERLWPFHMPSRKLASNWKALSKNPTARKLQKWADSYVYMDKIVMWLKIMVSCVPAAVIGLLFDDWIEAHLNNYVVVALMLIVYGIFFLWIEDYNKNRRPIMRRLSDISFQTALFIGIFQLLSIVPGTSRSGATIIGGILLGTSRKLAAEYTFFLAIPVMFGASLLKICKAGFVFCAAEIWIMLVGMAVAFLVSIFAIRFLMNYIKKHDFKVFGWYRIVLGALVLVYFLMKTILA